jgi:hypothetical protein
LQLAWPAISTVMRGHSRPKDGVASLAYDPRIHEPAQRYQFLPPPSQLRIMDCRVKPGNDVDRLVQPNWKALYRLACLSALK